MSNEVVKAVLNGISLLFARKTGELLRINLDDGCVLTDAECGGGTGIDMAYPMGKFEILRTGMKYSDNAVIKISDECVTVTIDCAGMSHKGYIPSGSVKIVNSYRADNDKISILMECRIENNSDNEIKQVLFPDIDGILPVEGEEGTFFTTCGFRNKPFKELKADIYGERGFFANRKSNAGQEHSSGGYFYLSKMIGRWFDIGGYNNGLSLYQKWWGWGPDNDDQSKQLFWTKLNQKTGKLRVSVIHNVTVKPGECWDSCEYILTAHKGGWAAGIKPYAKWISKRLIRAVPVPRHIKEDLGFRTIWMTEQYPEAPESTVWKYEDLPEIAKETKEHGINEIVVWGLNKWEIPFTKDCFHESLGGYDEFMNALKKCREIDVRIVPFVSYMSVWNETAANFGLKIGNPEDSWSYHTKFIPVFRPPYGFGMCCAWCNQDDKIWQAEVMTSLVNYLELGMPSISWDQFSIENKKPNIGDLISEYRKKVYEIDSEASFSGESCHHIEFDAEYLDYTWDWWYWPATGDLRAFVNAFPSPRLNVLVDGNPMDVKYIFMDNLFLCAWPSKSDGINGSAWYADCPDLSAAIKQCSKLREKFLDYFVDGKLIGDCVLKKECSTARINGYLLPEKILMIVLNETDETEVVFEYDAGRWLAASCFKFNQYDNYGNLIVSLPKIDTCGIIKTQKLAKGQFMFYEFIKSERD